MKLTGPIIILLCLPLLLCSQVQAEHSGPYGGAALGVNSLMDSRSSDDLGSFGLGFTPALLGSIFVGWDFEKGNPVGEGRIELEYSHRSNPVDQVEFVEGSFKGGGRVTADSLLCNFFGTIHDNSPWSPYAGAGIGAARIEASGLQVTGQAMGSGSAVVFAYQLGTGFEYAVSENLVLDLGYRFFNSSRPRFHETSGHDFTMGYVCHTATLGLKVGF